MVFGSPFSDKYPARVWESLKKSRKGKDALASLYKFVNSTKVYEHVLKHTPRYWVFTIVGGFATTYFLSSVCDEVWRRVNKGRLYIHMNNETTQSEE